MKKSIKSIAVLFVICGVVAVLLALTNTITSPIIQKSEAEAVNRSLLLVMPDGKNFEKLEFDSEALPKTITEIYREENGGYVFKMKTVGYSSDFIIMCGVTKEGTVSGALCLSSKETLGYEKTFGENLIGKTISDIDTVDTVSGATKTTDAYRNAIKDALDAAKILSANAENMEAGENT